MLRKMPRSGISQLKSSIANEQVPNEAFKNAEPFSTHAPYNLRNSNQSDDVQSDIHQRPRRSWSNGSLPAVHGHEWAGFAPVDCGESASNGPYSLVSTIVRTLSMNEGHVFHRQSDNPKQPNPGQFTRLGRAKRGPPRRRNRSADSAGGASTSGPCFKFGKLTDMNQFAIEGYCRPLES